MSESRPRLLMCRPNFYGVDYVINPWMRGNVGRAQRDRAQSQWDGLCSVLAERATLEFVSPVEGYPDMPFVANAGLVYDSTFVPSRFRFVQRQGETPHHVAWFRENDFTVAELRDKGTFEGEGDALFQPGEALLWGGYGVRTSLQVYRELGELLNVEIALLRLIDERFYHLDTCFCPLEGGRVVYYPDALDQESRDLVRSRIAPENRVEVSADDALKFACNAVVAGNTFVANHASDSLRARLEDWGYDVQICPLTEFLLAGGAAKCLVLKLEQTLGGAGQAPVAPGIAERTVEVQGQLLDTGLMNEMLDCITESGGSFEIETFRAGLRHDQESHGEIRVVAPTVSQLDTIVSNLMRLGARVSEEDRPARLEAIVEDGVAPRDFYSTTIYPTDVRLDDAWVRVARQRMDAVIVVRDGGGEAAAQCVLMRDLKKGDRIVCGVDGIRVDTARDAGAAEAFEFMGSGVSSERRVELVVDEIAWEMRRIRDRGGKIVVVAGPVVVHTGGATYLSELVRAGYVQALLGGNAVAAHDIESALFGTSLGVDLQRGTGVHGGHRHHLQAINLIRECGSIEAAVEKGVIKSGIFYECVRAQVPFSLAGSIRDDGPLPETRMDLVAAQAEYAELARGADMILMLSTMLHAIGVGNMTPAGVRLICVDINPAVVTKLADRGSLESTGVVTDVGLFLNLLAARLDGHEG